MNSTWKDHESQQFKLSIHADIRLYRDDNDIVRYHFEKMNEMVATSRPLTNILCFMAVKWYPCHAIWPMWSLTLKRKCCHFDEIFITSCTVSCQNDNFQCSQWWKCHQNEDISVSVNDNTGSCITTSKVAEIGEDQECPHDLMSDQRQTRRILPPCMDCHAYNSSAVRGRLLNFARL